MVLALALIVWQESNVRVALILSKFYIRLKLFPLHRYKYGKLDYNNSNKNTKNQWKNCNKKFILYKINFSFYKKIKIK